MAHLVQLFHGTTEAAARSILASGLNRTLYTTPDAQVAAEYAQLRASRQASAQAVVALVVPAPLLHAMTADQSAHVKPLFPGSFDMQQVIFREGAWVRLKRCELRAWSLDPCWREEIECATTLEQAG
jgi:hypothetical protein